MNRTWLARLGIVLASVLGCGFVVGGLTGLMFGSDVGWTVGLCVAAFALTFLAGVML